MRRRLVLLLPLLAAGCSLPLPSGVHTPDGVRGQGRPAELQVLPQGPITGQGPKEIVEGFLAAQASPTDDYAIARQFLTGEAARAWDPGRGIRVYTPESERVTLSASATGQDRQPTVSLRQVATVDRAGHYTTDPATIAAEAYGMTKVGAGYRISRLPAWTGLQLSPIDLQRTYAIRNVYYLAPQRAPGRHLVPDRVLLPAGPALNDELVRRLLDAPSKDLVGSVEEPSAPSLTLLSVEGSGVVTVTVSHDVDGLSPDEVRDLQAQLVWTLKQDERFTGLRLRTANQVIRGDGESDVVPATAFASYDPNALPANPPYAYLAPIADGNLPGRLRSTTALTPSELTATDRLDSIAVNPRADRIAALRRRGNDDQVLLGSAKSSRVTTGPSARGLTSPTWGSGEIGLWMLQGSDRLVRWDLVSDRLQQVPLPSRPAGRLRSLAVSRDGVRAALAIGEHVYVGRIAWSPAGTPSVVGLTAVDTDGTPQQVVWSTPTELVVLGSSAVQRVSIDGSTAAALVNLGTNGPSSITAAGPTVLFSFGGKVYSAGVSAPVQGSGAAPVFPG